MTTNLAIKRSVLALKLAFGLLALYLVLWIAILAATPPTYIYGIRTFSDDRPYASRLLLPGWVFETYWRLLGEQRLRDVAERDTGFVMLALGTWYMSETDKSIDEARAEQYLAHYLCIRASSPEGAKELASKVASLHRLKKPKLLLETCTTTAP